MNKNSPHQKTALDIMVSGNSNALNMQPSAEIFTRQTNPSGNPGTSLNDYWIAWKRSLKYVLLFILLFSLLMLALAMLKNDTYTSKTSVKIETDHTRILEYDVDTSRPPSYINDDIFYNTQYKLLRNRDLARKVINELELEAYLLKEKTFIEPVYVVTEWADRLKNTVKSWLPAQSEGQDKAENVTAEEVFFERLSINPVRRSRVIDIHYTSQDPVLSQKVLSAYIDSFIQSQHDLKTGASEEAKRYLGEQIERSRIKVQTAEEALLGYARNNNIVDTQSDVSVIGSNIALLNEAYIKAKSRRIDAESQYQNKKNISTLLNAGADPVIQAKKQELSSLQAEYRAKSSLFKPAYPEMLELKRQINQLTKYIRTESKDIKANTTKNMQANYIATLEEEKKLKREIKRLEKDLMTFYENSIGYASLKREVDTSRNLYEGLLQRLKEISVVGPVPGDNVAIVDSPELPARKDGLSYGKFILLGAFLGFVLYSLLTFLREMFSPKVRSEKSLKMLANRYPVLSSVPEVNRGFAGLKSVTAHSVFDTNAAESLRYLRTSLQLTNGSGMIPQTLHITSPNAGDGKSTMAIFLATSLANTGKKVLLIDADLRKPSIHKKLHIPNLLGLTNFLFDGEIKAHKYSLKNSPAFFMTITAGPAVADPVDTLDSKGFTRLLAKSRGVFDHIIIDSPPVLGMADSSVISNYADGTVLIVTSNTTRKSDAIQAIQRLEQGSGKIAGLVCNKTDRSFSKNYYNTKYSDGRAMITAPATRRHPSMVPVSTHKV